MLALAAINFAASVLTGNSVHFNRGDTWVVVAYLAWGFVYFAHFWGLNGRTAGGGLFGVQVVTDDGGDVSGRRAVGRTLAFPLSFLILGLGFLGILLGDRRRALHDVIAGTAVVYFVGRAGGAAAVAVPAPVLRSARSARIAQPARIAGPGRPALLTRTRRFVRLRPDAVVVVILRRDCPRDRHRGRRAVLTYTNGWLVTQRTKTATREDRKWPVTWVGVAEFEPAASSSRSQRVMWSTTALTPSDLPRTVRGRPLASAGICGGCYSDSPLSWENGSC